MIVIKLRSLWTYEGKTYRVIGTSRGAGSLKGRGYVQYEPCYDCEYSSFVRPLDEFIAKFTELTT